MLGSGVQVNLIYMPCLLISSRPISSNFLIDSSYPKYKQSYLLLNTSGQGNGGIHSPATLEQIIKVKIIFIDNPIISPIFDNNYERKRMTDMSKYKNVSLSKETYSTLEKLSKVILPDAKLSISKTIESIANEKAKKLNGKIKKG